MKSILFVEFPEQAGAAAGWLAQAPKGEQRGLVVMRKECEAVFEDRKLPYISFLALAPDAGEYRKLDTASRALARDWPGLLTQTLAPRFHGRSLGTFFFNQMSGCFFWLLRQLLLMEKCIVRQMPARVYFFDDDAPVVTLAPVPGDSVLPELIEALAKKYGFERVALKATHGAARPPETSRTKDVVRGGFYELHRRLEKKADTRRTVLLCGSSAVLMPVADSLRSSRLLKPVFFKSYFDRRQFVYWLKTGVSTLTPDALPTAKPAPQGHATKTYLLDGIDIAFLAAKKIAFIFETAYPRLLSRLAVLRQTLERSRAGAVLLDDDVTEFNKSVVFAAQSLGIETTVCQHGLPADPVGFLPLAADFFAAWGDESAERLTAWGMDAEKIVRTGAPRYDHLFKRGPDQASTTQVFLVLAKTKPSFRPARASLDHLTLEYTGKIIERAFLALKTLPGTRLVVKPHPAETQVKAIEALLKRYAQGVAWTLAAYTLPAGDCMRGCALVAGMESAAMLEALIRGIPSVCMNFSGKEDAYDLVKNQVSLGVYDPGQTVAVFSKALSVEYRQAFDARRPALLAHYFSDTGGNASEHLAERIASRLSLENKPEAAYAVR